MSKIEFVSHEDFPDDKYTKELVYLCLEGKYRIAFVRKISSKGGLFWSVASVGVDKSGKKEYYPAFIQDSNFLEKDIKDYLEKRLWDSKHSVNQSSPSKISAIGLNPANSMDEVVDQMDMPF